MLDFCFTFSGQTYGLNSVNLKDFAIVISFVGSNTQLFKVDITFCTNGIGMPPIKLVIPWANPFNMPPMFDVANNLNISQCFSSCSGVLHFCDLPAFRESYKFTNLILR